MTSHSPSDTPATPATADRIQAASAEFQAIMTNPAHPMHTDYLRGDQKVLDHIHGLYEKALETQPATPPDAGLELIHGTSQPEDQAMLSELREQWGEAYPANMALAQTGLKYAQAKFGVDHVDNLIGSALDLGISRADLTQLIVQIGRRVR